MKKQVSPAVTIIAIVVILAVIITMYLMTGRRESSKEAEVARTSRMQGKRARFAGEATGAAVPANTESGEAAGTGTQ